MIVNKIRLVGLYTVDLPIAVAHPSDSYILKGADGFGPSKKTVTIVDSTIQGGTYQGQRASNKQLVLTVGLNPNFKMEETAASLRSKLYGLLTPDGTDSITAELMYNDDVIAFIEGYVSDMVPNIFTQEPEVQVTVDCVWPYFQAPSPVVLVPETKDAFVLSNAGNARTGIEVEVMFLSDRNVWRLFGTNGEVMHFDYEFQSGDTLKFNTTPGQRFIKLLPPPTNGTPNPPWKNILHSLAPDSSWLFLRGGDNEFTTGSQDFNWVSITYTPQYEGL